MNEKLEILEKRYQRNLLALRGETDKEIRSSIFITLHEIQDKIDLLNK